VVARVVLAVVIVAVAAVVAWWLERRRVAAPPTQGRAIVPAQLNRHDFARPDAPWLVVLFTSEHCDSCAGLMEKAQPLASNDVSVTEIEYGAHPELHRRYQIEAAPITLLVDASGVTRASFVGAFAATDLWTALAELRAQPKSGADPAQAQSGDPDR
jgi:hypothetical protein